MIETVDLPKGWEIKKIKDVGVVKDGKRLPKGDIYAQIKLPFHT
jgi:hypothetical protein